MSNINLMLSYLKFCTKYFFAAEQKPQLLHQGSECDIIFKRCFESSLLLHTLGKRVVILSQLQY
jgi:hypothetical protein